MIQTLPSYISSQTNDYNVIGLLGKGAFATVYTAINIQTNEKVALKVIEKQTTCLYKREADIHLLLNHCCVIQLKDVLCEMDLFQAIDGCGAFTCQVIYEVFNQILDGMVYCHSRSVFHRDLKPDNILIAKDFSVRICDFGLSTCADWSYDFGCGSLRYMGPECFFDMTRETSIQGYSTKKSDVWSIGIILFNMITGKNPWNSAILTDPAYVSYLNNPQPLAIEFNIHDDFHTLLKKILDPNPFTRISLSELKKEFNECSNWFVEMNSSDDDDEGFHSDNNSISSQSTRVTELTINTSYEQTSNSEKSPIDIGSDISLFGITETMISLELR